MQKIISKTLEQLHAENKIMRQLATREGFYKYYFSQLKHHETNTDCFNAVNELYFDLFGEYRYSNYKVFMSGYKVRKK